MLLQLGAARTPRAEHRVQAVDFEKVQNPPGVTGGLGHDARVEYVYREVVRRTYMRRIVDRQWIC